MDNLYGYSHSRKSSLETELTTPAETYSASGECRSCGKIADVNADDCCVVCEDILRDS